MISRHLAGPLRDAAAKMPVVVVSGPRQSGKTRLCRQTFPDLRYVSLESVDTRKFAMQDPRGFLSEHRNGVILGEIQRVPEPRRAFRPDSGSGGPALQI